MVVYLRLVVVRARAEDDVADLVYRADSSERTGKNRYQTLCSDILPVPKYYSVRKL